MARIFLTGGSGFLGRELVPALRRDGHSCICLQHSTPIPLSDSGTVAGALEVVSGSLSDISSFERALATADVVLHLAAATGKADPESHAAVNASGTENLVRESKRLGIDRFLFVSSIAVKFPDKRGYPYALSKEMGEKSVRAAGLRFAIVRPAIIIGQGSASLAAMEMLSGFPVIPVFGDGETLVQPIYVSDLVDFIRTVVRDDAFDNEVIELGGPTVVSIEDVLQALRVAATGARGPTIHIPLRPLMPLLRALESVSYRLVPFTTGQLATFRFAGVAEAHPIFEARREQLKPLPEMLELSSVA